MHAARGSALHRRADRESAPVEYVETVAQLHSLWTRGKIARGFGEPRTTGAVDAAEPPDAGSVAAAGAVPSDRADAADAGGRSRFGLRGGAAAAAISGGRRRVHHR